MIDIRQLVTGLTQTIAEADFPDAVSLANALDLDISTAQISTMKSRDTIISGGQLKGESIEIDVICVTNPWREIWLLFHNSSLSYKDTEGEIYGTNQRIAPSKLSDGFGVLFEIAGLTCGYTASSPDGDVESIFCEEREAAHPAQGLSTK